MNTKQAFTITSTIFQWTVTSVINTHHGRVTHVVNLQYIELSSTYLGSDGEFYVATISRIYAPDSSNPNGTIYEENQGTLMIPGTVSIRREDGEDTFIGDTHIVEAGDFARIRKATPEEISAAYEYQREAGERGFTLNEDGTWKSSFEYCFLAGTEISMWPLDPDVRPGADGHYDEKEVLAKVWQKPIEEVAPDDWVVSSDRQGRLKPGRVTRTFQNTSKHILDVHGLMMTPGHVTWCAKVEGEENRFADSYAPILDILRSDGAIMRADGTLIRAATGCEIGSEDDKPFWAFKLYTDKDGTERMGDRCQLRLGTRWMLSNGNHFSMRDYMEGIGIELIKEGPHAGYVRWKKTGLITVFAWTLSESLPKPEDFVLQRSQVRLEEIYAANEWEGVRPQMPAPMRGEAGQSYPSGNMLYAASTANTPSSGSGLTNHLPPNIPFSMQGHSNQPTMTRQQRRALERKQKKAAGRAKVLQ